MSYTANDEIRIFNSVVLTASTSGNISTSYEHRSYSGITLLVNYSAHASSPSAYAEVIVEISYDGSTWVPYGEWTQPSTGKRLFESTDFQINQTYPSSFLTLDELRGRYFRVKAKEVGTTASFFGSLTVYAYTHSN